MHLTAAEERKKRRERERREISIIGYCHFHYPAHCRVIFIMKPCSEQRASMMQLLSFVCLIAAATITPEQADKIEEKERVNATPDQMQLISKADKTVHTANSPVTLMSLN